MDLTFNADETAFRDELRAWLAANPPEAEPGHDELAHYTWRRDYEQRFTRLVATAAAVSATKRSSVAVYLRGRSPPPG